MVLVHTLVRCCYYKCKLDRKRGGRQFRYPFPSLTGCASPERWAAVYAGSPKITNQCSDTEENCERYYKAAHPPDWFVAGRLSAEYWLLRNGLLRLFTGLGMGGMDTGLVYGTLDTGLLLTYEFSGRLTPYAAGFVALSAPFARGNIIDENQKPGTTIYGGGVVGLAVRIMDSLFLSGEWVLAPVLAGQSAEPESFVSAGSVGMSVRFR